MATESRKYWVWKGEDVEAFFEGMGAEGVHEGGTEGIYITDFVDRALDDAEVLRLKDITVAPILHHYASSITTLIELAKEFGLDIDLDALRVKADWAHEAALRAETHPGKRIPD